MLNHHEYCLLFALILAYFYESYNKKTDVMNFDVQGHKTTISKVDFYKLLKLKFVDVYTIPELVSSLSIIRVYY